MATKVKVFVSGEEQNIIRKNYNVIEIYDSFLLAEVTPSELKTLESGYLVEDVSAQYKIDIGLKDIDTNKPRITERGLTEPHPAYAGTDEKNLGAGKHHFLVQFIGPIKKQWLTNLKKYGAEPRAPYSDFTYVVRATEKNMAEIATLPFVLWTGHLPYEARIETVLQAKTKGTTPRGMKPLPRTKLLEGVFTVEFFGEDDAAKAVKEVKKIGFKVLANEVKAKLLIVESKESSAGQKSQVKELSQVHGVRKIRERAINRPSNDVAAGIMGTALSMATTGAKSLGLSGKGETIGICDTGLDTGDPDNINKDFAKRIAFIKSYPITPDFNDYVTNPGGDDGPADLDSGHGTHVAGSVLGDGTNSAGLAGTVGPVRGLAYKAKLVFQAVEQELKWKDPAYITEYGRYLLAGIPSDLNTLFTYAYQKGARIHSNSWGGGNPGEYDEQCRQLDLFIWNKKDFCVTVAAGNDGTDKDGDGKINPMSVTSPGTAKNCITIGASENKRINFNSEKYGSWWPGDYPVAPISNDPMADKPTQVAAFSSRGPTRDKRIKPDVVAPGTFILSTRSSMIAPNNTAWAPFPASKQYFHMGGTSMATPLAAGAVALVREYLRTVQKIASPTAALLKAAVIAGANKLPGISAATTPADNHQGYGCINIDNIVTPASPSKAYFIESKTSLNTGQSFTLNVKILSNKIALKIVLAYTDYPGSALVNNLNLIVTAPNGKKYTGNTGVDGVTTFDANNNVESLLVSKPAAGKWKFEVIAANIPQGPQDFALVYIAHA
jgi:serine protease AprX